MNLMKKSSIGNFFELYQKNILILGFGRIGQAVAKRCKGFDAIFMFMILLLIKKLLKKMIIKSRF